MANTIISKVYLLDTPLKNDYKDTFYFGSKATQETYFQGRIKHTFNNVSYLRKDQVIKLNVQYDTICTCNYLMYQNTAYSNKWIYCFIKDMKYISEGVTEVEIETDVIQTWLFDYTVNRSFVEREHVSDDTVGKHTINENLEVGEYICNLMQEDSQSDRMFIYLAYSDYSGSSTSNIRGNLYGGIYSGMGLDCYNTTTEGVKSLNNQLTNYDKAGKSDSINAIFMGPAWLYEPSLGYENFTAGVIEPSTGSKSYTIKVDKQTTLNGYTPRNKKLLCYPYNYLSASNNSGNAAIYKYEEFATSDCQFIVQGVITPGMSIRMHPFSYKGVGNNYDEGLTAGKYPVCSWNSDAYTNWLTQNSVNNALSIGSGVLQIAAGVGMAIGTGGLGMAVGGGSVAGGISTIAGVMAQKHQASLVPDQLRGNTNSGDVVTASHVNKFMFYKMSVKQEVAKVIDNYFDMFGYTVNEVKVPNKNHRANHWYTKTIDANITGEIPGNDLQKIKDCYNQGISFWKTPSNIYRYDLANGTI